MLSFGSAPARIPPSDAGPSRTGSWFDAMTAAGARQGVSMAEDVLSTCPTALSFSHAGRRRENRDRADRLKPHLCE
jgi:hypothetical protein